MFENRRSLFPISRFCMDGRLHAVAGAAALLCSAAPAKADNLTVTADQDLRYGSMVVPSAGSRTVSTDGLVTDSGVMPVAGPTGPAQFTIRFDGGGGLGSGLLLVMQVTLSNVGPVNVGGVTGTLSNFTTDLPGLPSLLPGQPAIVTLTACTSRPCTQTFHVGATLTMSRSSGGGTLSIPLPLTATIVAAL